MQYKTMMLELLQQQAGLHRHLQASRILLPVLDASSHALKACHLTWEERLTSRQGLDPAQIPSIAMEFAIKEMEHRLQSVSLPERQDRLSLEAALALLTLPTLPG